MSDAGMSLAEWALAYQEQGFHVIPCRPRSKVPMVEWKRWQHTPPSATDVTNWWRAEPSANIALVLGRGVFAVDLDGGDAAESLLLRHGVELPVFAPRSRTGKGYHVFLSSGDVPVADAVKIVPSADGGPQVDIRGVGIVVVPPSIHPSGAAYEWLIPFQSPTDAPDAPESLFELLGHRQTTSTSQNSTRDFHREAWVTHTLRGVGEGQRDAACTRLAGYFLKSGLPTDVVEFVLRETFAKSCVPPFPSHDVAKCVTSIARKEGAKGELETTDIEPQHIAVVLAELQAQMAKGASPSLPTGYEDLDGILQGGFQPGDLVLLGARPGVGKTALALTIASHAATRGPVVIVSREMKNISLARRLLSQTAHVTGMSLKNPDDLRDFEIARITQAVSDLSQTALYLTDEAVSIGEIADIFERMSGEVALSLAVVDYLQLVRAPKDIKDRRHQVEYIGSKLKELALRYSVPILCLSSLSRANAKEDRPPRMDDLRESGELEHDADSILLLHREFGANTATCIIAKNRDGGTGQVQLTFQSDIMRFEPAAQFGIVTRDGRDYVRFDED